MTDNKPLHRHPSLQPLSRHHHHALVLAQKLIKSTVEQVDSVKTDLKRFWESHGNQHFQEEECILLPTYAKYADPDRAEIVRMLLEHVKIRSQILSILANPNATQEELINLGELLQQHVRFEERVVFPMIQDTVPDDELRTLPDFMVTSEDER